MKLQELINLKPGEGFVYKGIPATVKITDFESEKVGETDDGKPLFHNNFNLFFETAIGEEITLYSGHPKPERLELEDFELSDDHH